MAKVQFAGGGLAKIRYLANGKAVQSVLEQPLATALEVEIGAIVKRTQRGQDVDNAGFRRYSEPYRKWKAGETKGKTARKLRKRRPDAAGVTDTVNLTLSGLMLKSITSTVARVGSYLEGKIFITGGSYAGGPRVEDVARWNNATRKFFGLSREQIARISRKLKAALKL
jgi:hypothetical protein